MPLVRIDLLEGRDDAWRQQLGTVVHEAMVGQLNVPADDRFQVITEHPHGGMSIDRSYLGIERSDACVIVQVTLNTGRSVAMKQAFYLAVANGLHAVLGLRREDVVISLVEVVKENWSFGNGIAQYA